MRAITIASIILLFFINTYSITADSIHIDKASPNYSGVYSSLKGTVTISINDGILSGYYECYGNWSEQYKEYLNINIFYFYGKSKDGINFNVVSFYPGDFKKDMITGNVSFSKDHSKIKILLKDLPSGYSFVDFTEDTPDIIFNLKNEINIKGVRYVKVKKAFTYNYLDNKFTQRKAYLIRENIVSIVDTKDIYSKISYHNITTGKTNEYWIKSSDLYDADPELWDK